MKFRKDFVFEFLLLELMCYVPIVIIIGNISPSIGFIKIHWLYIGLVFINTLIILCKSKRAVGLLFLLCMFAIVQCFISIKFSIIDFIDFVSGPLLFIAVVNIIISNKIKESNLFQLRRKTLACFSIPIIISLLQYVKVVPLAVLNADYVNITDYGSGTLERVNGFLYHGIELAVIIFFFFTSVGLLTSNLKTYLILIGMFLFELITIIKSGIMTAILYAGFFSYFIDKKLRSAKSIVIVCILFFGFSYFYILIPDLQADRFSFDKREFKFEDQLFTGRGFIWNTYIRGIKAFTPSQIIFGGGYGSASIIFKKKSIGATDKWLPGPHNQLLEIFINGGIFAIWFISHVLRKQYKKLSTIFEKNKSIFRKYYLGILFIPLLIMGLTAPIMNMYVYWCGLSTVMITLKLKFSED